MLICSCSLSCPVPLLDGKASRAVDFMTAFKTLRHSFVVVDSSTSCSCLGLESRVRHEVFIDGM